MDNKYDKLEQYFRNTILKDDTDTSIPSDELFANAMNVVNSEKKRRRFFLLPYLISLCIILSLLLYKSQLEIIKLRNQKINSVALHEDKKSQILSPSINQSKTLSETKISGSSEEILNQNEVSKNKIFKANFVAEKGIFTKNDILNIDPGKIIVDESKTNITDISEEIKINALVKPTILYDYKVDQLPLVVSKSLSSENIQVNKLSIMAVTKSLPETKNTQKSKSLNVGIAANINLSNFCMNNIPSAGSMRLTQYEKHKFGSGINIYLEKNIGKNISYRFVAGYQKYNNQSLLEDKMVYDNNKVTIASNGEIYYQSDVNLSNPLVDKRSSTMINLEKTMNNNEVINEVNSICQQLQTLSLGLELNRNILSDKRFKLKAGAQLSGKFIIKSENRFDVTLSTSDFIHKHYEELSLKNEVSNFFTMIHGSLTGQYRLSENIDIQLSAGYQQSLSSLRLKSSDKDPNTYLRNYIFSLGSSYNF